MYILESIQEFDGKKIAIYIKGKDSGRKKRKAINLLVKNTIPLYAIITEAERITKGTHKLYVNNSSFTSKTDEFDGTEFNSLITI